MAELKGTLKASNFLKGKLLPFGVSPGAVLYNKVQNLSEEEKARARANIGVGEGGGGVEGADTSAVFYAEYGVTTMDEIRAAFDAGKAVFAFRGVYGAGMIGQLVNISGAALFVCHDGMNNLFFNCNQAGWGEGYFAPSTGYYVPSVDTDGNLSWEASEGGMPPVESRNIKGEKGEDGHTPERGVDYWTEEDKTFVVLAAVTQVKNDELSTTALSVDWSSGKVVETLSDGRTVTHNMTFDANGIPTKIGNLNLTISGVD